MKQIYIITLTIALGAGFATSLLKCGKRQAKTITQISEQKNDSGTYYRDLWHAEHLEKLQVSADMKTIKALYGKPMVDSLLRRIDAKDKQLVSWSSILAEAQGRASAPLDTVWTVQKSYDDSTKTERHFGGYSCRIDDGILSGIGYINDSVNRLTLDWHLSINLNRATKWKRRWFLGRKRYITDVWSNDSRVHIAGFTDVKIN